MKLRTSTVQKSNVDLIPMIDVVFQLILFFLVSTTFALLPAISVKLPTSSTSESVGGNMTITLSNNGSIWLDSEKVTLAELDTKLAEYEVVQEERKEFPVKLEADEDVTNGIIVKVFDVLRKNGFAAVNLRTTTE